nr:hypothetical protein [Variovorax boronicumulans]
MGPATALSRPHARRLREVYRSAGWPWQDVVELELLALGLLERLHADGRDSVRLTEAGIQAAAQAAVRNQRARSAHETLVERVAREQGRAGRIAWRGLALRALLPPATEGADPSWCMACPDVFSIRNTSVPTYVDPVVHEIKVSRADLLGDLRKPAKRQAYLDLGGQCWYVLGRDARGRAIGDADDVPAECGVLVLQEDGQLSVQRNAQRRERLALPHHVWMALARATPCAGLDEDAQQLLRGD